jgi:hypothetical protein
MRHESDGDSFWRKMHGGLGRLGFSVSNPLCKEHEKDRRPAFWCIKCLKLRKEQLNWFPRASIGRRGNLNVATHVKGTTLPGLMEQLGS